MTQKLLGVIALLAGALFHVPHDVALAQPAPLKMLRAEPDAWPTGTWQQYKDKFLKPDGRVVDDANGNISHSEGQGYGMLLAVMADDAATFNRIWTWTRTELMRRPDGLASWKWESDKSPNITDANNASDGDLLIAWALAEAAERWARPDYTREAARISVALDKATGARSSFGRVFLPGADGFSATARPDGPVVNLSYWIFPAIDRLKSVAPSVDWDGYRASGYTLARAAQFGQAKLPTDWISIARDKAVPAEGFPPRFSYNAVRLPLYLAWANNVNKDALRPYVSFGDANNQSVPEYDVTTNAPVDQMGGKGYLAVFALAKCAFDGTPVPAGLRSVSLDQYYPTTLHMLALGVARLRFGKCL